MYGQIMSVLHKAPLQMYSTKLYVSDPLTLRMTTASPSTATPTSPSRRRAGSSLTNINGPQHRRFGVRYRCIAWGAIPQLCSRLTDDQLVSHRDGELQPTQEVNSRQDPKTRIPRPRGPLKTTPPHPPKARVQWLCQQDVGKRFEVGLCLQVLRCSKVCIFDNRNIGLPKSQGPCLMSCSSLRKSYSSALKPWERPYGFRMFLT